MLSRTVEDTGTVTSPLVPWNSCGAYMTGVLGVPTIEYLPFAFFNLLNPILAIVFGFTGYRVEHQAPEDASLVRADDDHPGSDIEIDALHPHPGTCSRTDGTREAS